MTNWYAKAIEKLANVSNEDAKLILFRIAQKKPKAIVDAFTPDKEPEPKWVNDCRMLLRSERKIDAIKLWRSETGDGLKEAKDAVESLIL